MLTLKSLFPVVATAIMAVACSDDKNDNIIQQADNAKTYSILGKNIVAVTKEHDDVAAFLKTGDKTSANGDQRRSIYYLNKGLVMTEYHTDSKYIANSGLHGVQDMTEEELEEFSEAKKLYHKVAHPSAATAQKSKIDSLERVIQNLKAQQNQPGKDTLSVHAPQ